MKIAVIGGAGQLVLSLLECADSEHEIVAVGRPKLDLATGDDEAMTAALADVQPDAIVNAAAYTAVDSAENGPDLAFAINAQGAGSVARAAKRLAVPLVHMSTDYVFSGNKLGAYIEGDATGPANVYGASKLAGEKAVWESGADATILRTAWVFSPFGTNFLQTMLRLAETRDQLDVVADQRGGPTSALDLAKAIIAVLDNLKTHCDPHLRGLFHCTGSGEASWAELAEACFAISAANGGPFARVNPISTAAYPSLAKRPINSLLDCGKLWRTHHISMPDWRLSVADVVARLVVDRQNSK